MLTKKQKLVLDYIKGYQKKNGYSPSFEEIRKHFKLASVSTVDFYITKLINGGYLDKKDNKARSISVMKEESLIKIPLLGTIAAGQPIEAIQEKETIAIAKSKISKGENIYALRVAGTSMIEENINDGDIVLIKNQPTAENGQKIVALIDNSEVTLKKYYKEKNQIRLQPANSEMQPIYIKPSQLTIQGIVVDIIKNNESNFTEQLIIPKNIKRSEKLPLNKIICGDCVEVLKSIPDNSIDLVVTSPPYDGIRKYNGFSFNLHSTGKELFRVLKDGGIIAMVIQDQTKNFGKSLTSFKTIIDWCENVGFKLFETIIYKKHGAEGAWWTKRFRVDHEYIPIFLKGERPAYFNKEPLKIPSKHGGKTMTGCATRLTNGKTLKSKRVFINPMKCRGTLWDYTTCGDGTRLKHQHPATFPDKIPVDFIRCFCPKNGIVLDPFIGSGTTALAAIQLNRNYIGIDISKEYCELAKKRIREEIELL